MVKTITIAVSDETYYYLKQYSKDHNYISIEAAITNMIEDAIYNSAWWVAKQIG